MTDQTLAFTPSLRRSATAAPGTVVIPDGRYVAVMRTGKPAKRAKRLAAIAAAHTQAGNTALAALYTLAASTERQVAASTFADVDTIHKGATVWWEGCWRTATAVQTPPRLCSGTQQILIRMSAGDDLFDEIGRTEHLFTSGELVRVDGPDLHTALAGTGVLPASHRERAHWTALASTTDRTARSALFTGLADLMGGELGRHLAWLAEDELDQHAAARRPGRATQAASTVATYAAAALLATLFLFAGQLTDRPDLARIAAGTGLAVVVALMVRLAQLGKPARPCPDQDH